MTMHARLALTLVLAFPLASCVGPFSRKVHLDPTHESFLRAAPDSFDVEMVTTKGTMRVRARRHWSPNGVDRFHALVKSGFFTDVAFHRTMHNFVAQFGLHGDSAVNAMFQGKNIPDDSVRAPNRRGTLSYARGSRNTRSTQLFFNLVDNTPRLDTLNGFGFPPVGEIVRGIEVLDSLNWEYTGTRGGRTFPGPSQDSIRLKGNEYLRRVFPRLDYIVGARIRKSWRR
jgi:peptidyl-prolyl cis-trans isomerase A (cyclophilin A)